MNVRPIRLVRARKEHRCSEHSYHVIKPGDLCLYGAAPPWADWNTSGKWWVIRACLRCASEYSLHTSGTRAQLGQVDATRRAA